MSELPFYDAPTSPAGIFDHFLAIPSFESDIGTRSSFLLVQNQTASLQYVIQIKFQYPGGSDDPYQGRLQHYLRNGLPTGIP